MKQKQIALTRVAYAKQLKKVLINNGLSPEYYFKKVGLPTHDLENPESLLPLKPFWRLLNLVATEAGIPDFGAQFAEQGPWHKAESLRPLISNCKDLEDLLQTICRLAPSEGNTIMFSFEHGDTESWFGRTSPPLMKNDIQMELYTMTCAIQLVQLAVGPDWVPEQIDLVMKENKIAGKSRLVGKCRLNFSQNWAAFPIPNTILKLPVNLEIPDTQLLGLRFDVNASFVDTIEHVISNFIFDKDCRVKDISRVMGVHTRTLQRQLKSHGTNFNELLNLVKFKMAKEKLQNSSLTIQDISYQLGYSDPAHFTHAFNRWAGMSPSDYRQACISRR
jgi:AraC-like DNA-binding protein